MDLMEKVRKTLEGERMQLGKLYEIQGALLADSAQLVMTVRKNGFKEYYIMDRGSDRRQYASADQMVRVERLKLQRRIKLEIGIRENNCRWLEKLLGEYVDCTYEEMERRLPKAYRGAFLPAVGKVETGGTLGARDGEGAGAAQGIMPPFTQSEMRQYPGERWYRTSFGLQVRSKSEVIIAEQLYGAGIPFHYERQKLLMGGGEPEPVHPDFTIPLDGRLVREETPGKGRNGRDGSSGRNGRNGGSSRSGRSGGGQISDMLYWEHMGMMGNEGYRNSAFEKMAWYVESGILPGRDLILTMEAGDGDLDGAAIRRIIEGMILPQMRIW